MTLGQVNMELAMVPQSQEYFGLLKEIAELDLAEHLLYVQEHAKLEQQRHHDILFSESFFLEADESSDTKTQVEKKTSSVVEKLSKIAYKVLLLLKKTSDAINKVLARIGIRRQRALQELSKGNHTFTEAELQNIRKRMMKYCTLNELRTGDRDETYNIISKNQPGANQVKFKTDCENSNLVKEVKDMIAFGLGDQILVHGDGVVISNDSPFIMSVIHAYAAIGSHTSDIETLRQTFKNEQNRAAKSGILLKIKNDGRTDGIDNSKIMELAKSLGIDLAGSGLNRRSSETTSSPENAAYFAKAAQFWGDLSSAVAKTNRLMDQVAQFRTAAVAIVETTIGLKGNGKSETKDDSETNPSESGKKLNGKDD